MQASNQWFQVASIPLTLLPDFCLQLRVTLELVYLKANFAN